MTALTITGGHNSGAAGCVVVTALVVVMAVAAVSVGTSISHAFQHGADALMVQQCLDHKGHSSLWVNPYNDHYIRVCELDDGRVGLQVVKKVKGKWEEVTAFIPKRAGDIVKYLVDSGAELVWPK